MSERILVIDDDPDILRFVRMNLESEGYDVATAVRGNEGLEAALGAVPDLVLLDIMLPDTDGLEILHRLQISPATAHVGVILLTAKTQARDRIRGLELGAGPAFRGHLVTSAVVCGVAGIGVCLGRNRVGRRRGFGGAVRIRAGSR